jgi:flagellar basal body rod protein FlgF
MIVRLKGSKLYVKLNDQVVQQVDIDTARPKDKPLAQKGWIAIQDHGQEFWVRNVRIRKL